MFSKIFNKRLNSLTLAVLSTLALTACGGGGGDSSSASIVKT